MLKIIRVISLKKKVVSLPKANLFISKHCIDWFYMLCAHSSWNRNLICFSIQLKTYILDILNIPIDICLIMQKNKSHSSPNIVVSRYQNSLWGTWPCSHLFSIHNTSSFIIYLWGMGKTLYRHLPCLGSVPPPLNGYLLASHSTEEINVGSIIMRQ